MARLLWLLFLAPSLIAADFQASFDFYPAGSHDCLNSAAKTSKCHGKDATELNSCLCKNGGNFILNAAACIGKNDAADIEAVYSTMADACGNTSTGMSVSQQTFEDAANGKDTTTTTTTTTATTATTTSSSATNTATVTATSTSTNTPAKSDDKKESLSSGATIGIAVGASMAGVAFIALVAFYIIRRRRNSRAEEAHPMLPQHYQNSPGFSETKTGWDSKHSSTTYSPYGRESQNYTPQPFNRDSQNYTTQPYNRDSTAYAPSSLHTSPELNQSQYLGAFAPPHDVAELPPVAERNESIYEMDASNVSEQTRLAEAPGSHTYR